MTTATVPKQPKNDVHQAEPVEPSLLDKAIEATCTQLDDMADRYAGAIRGATGHLRRAMLIARGIEELGKAITPPMMKQIMQLQNKPLGFMTDQKEGYDEKTVKDVVIAGLLQGVFPTLNEFNVIKSRLYIAQSGYRRLVREIAYLTDLRLSPGVPAQHNGMTVVRFGATWKMHGVKQSLVDGEGKPGRLFAVTIQTGATPDNIVGKATRKALKAIYEQVMGSEIGTDDGEVTDVEAAEPVTAEAKTRVEQLASRLGEGKSTASRSQLDRIATYVLEGVFAEELSRVCEEAGVKGPEGIGRDQAEELLVRFAEWKKSEKKS